MSAQVTAGKPKPSLEVHFQHLTQNILHYLEKHHWFLIHQILLGQLNHTLDSVREKVWSQDSLLLESDTTAVPHISAVGQFLLLFLGPSAAASLLKHATPPRFSITALFAPQVVPNFLSPSSSSVCLSLVGQTCGRALLGMTTPSYKGWVDKEQECLSNG